MRTEILKNREIWGDEFKAKKEEERPVYEPVLDLITSIIERNNYTKILDYGCGEGRFGFYFKKKAKDRQLAGADIGEEALRLCSGIYDELYLTDGITLPEQTFDFIVLNSVLEHIPLDLWDVFFKEINKKLSERGAVFIVIPNKHGLMHRFTDTWKDEKEKWGHCSVVDIKFLKNKLRAFGFKNLRLSFLFKIDKLPDYIKCPGAFRKIIMVPLSIVNVYPFYYLRDSFWILAKRA
jgi:SAM-dependent methyltransferase